MTHRTAETSPLIYARVVGFLYLMLLPLGIFGILYVPSILIVPGDAATTANNIMASESLFRLSIVTALIVQIVNILVVLVLYKLLKPVNKNMALLMVVFSLVAVPIAVVNELNRAVWHAFGEHGIEMPFPQRDLHIRSGLPWQQLADNSLARVPAGAKQGAESEN